MTDTTDTTDTTDATGTTGEAGVTDLTTRLAPREQPDDAPVVLREPPPEVVDADDPAPPVDPRFRVRRTEVRRRMRRRRRRIWGSVLAVLLVAAAGVGVLHSPLTDVDAVRVRGVERLTTAEVVEATGLPEGSAMYAVDPAAVEERVGELPWVERARVAVRWPSTVEVRVVERPVLAVVTQGDHAYLVGRGGMVTRATAVPDDDAGPSIFADVGSADGSVAPRVEIPADESVRVGQRLSGGVGRAVEMLAAIPSAFRPVVTAAEIDELGELHFTVGLAAKVQMGTPDEAAAKFSSLETMLGGGVLLDCITDLDLRVPADPRITRAYRC